MSHLLRIERKVSREPLDQAAFPFALPVIRSLERLELGVPVTFFVGENGSGKSTLLEALAIASEIVTVGEVDAASDRSLRAQQQLARTLRLCWSRRSRLGFFLRAEDFFGYLKTQSRIDARLHREQRELAGTSGEVMVDDSMHVDERAAERFLTRYDARSHGESFLELFERRVRPGGLYLLDEPEAPLSPRRQMALLSLMHERAKQGAQFVIATHSPILLAFPKAQIFTFDRSPLQTIAYEALDHVQLTRHVLSDPARAMQELHDGRWTRAGADDDVP